MNKIVINFIVIVGLIVISNCKITAQTIPVNSVWRNQSGSSMQITGNTNGELTGSYVNNAPGYQCKGSPYPVVGWNMAGTNTITFTVMWENSYENCQSLTAWTGFISQDGQTITTLWQLVVNGTTSTSQIYSGADTFTRIAMKKHESLVKK